MAKNNPCFDGFSVANLIGKNHVLSEWRLKSKERGFDLVGIELDGGIEQRPANAINAISASAAEFVGEVFGVLWCRSTIDYATTISLLVNGKLEYQMQRIFRRYICGFSLIFCVHSFGYMDFHLKARRMLSLSIDERLLWEGDEFAQ